eukprot:123309-Chlamydomonas_euryale.AAC.2
MHGSQVKLVREAHHGRQWRRRLAPRRQSAGATAGNGGAAVERLDLSAPSIVVHEAIQVRAACNVNVNRLGGAGDAAGAAAACGELRRPVNPHRRGCC